MSYLNASHSNLGHAPTFTDHAFYSLYYIHCKTSDISNCI